MSFSRVARFWRWGGHSGSRVRILPAASRGSSQIYIHKLQLTSTFPTLDFIVLYTVQLTRSPKNLELDINVAKNGQSIISPRQTANSAVWSEISVCHRILLALIIKSVC